MDRDFNIFMEKQDTTDRRDSLPIFREYAIDLDTCQPIYENGDILELEGKEALRVWIFRALKTELNTYEVHSRNYGNELREHIGTVYNETIKQLLMKEQIIDCLMVNPYIIAVSKFAFDKMDYDVMISFQVDTIYGEIRQEVIGIGY